MINRLFPRAALHLHADPAQRVLGAAELPPDSDELARLLAADPVPEVRAAAAGRCTDLALLAAASAAETDPSVQAALASALGNVLSETGDIAGATALLDSDPCTDALRSEVARRTADPDRRRIAIAGIRDEGTLIELALAAQHAETRIAAAERVHTPEGLRKLADAAKNRDHGVARLARQRLDAIENRLAGAAEADAILAQLEALTTKSGPIVTAVVELNRRWQALDLGGDPERLARCEAARQALQARFDRERDEQRARAAFERRLRESTGTPELPSAPDAIAALRAELASLRDEARRYGDDPALAKLDETELRIARREEDRQAQAGAEALVVEAEQLAAGTSIDHATLPERWQALDRAIRTPALTRRFEAALIVIEQRRLAQIRAAEQEAGATRQKIHGLLHAAEQALAAGQLQAARMAAEEIRMHKAGAGPLPKPTTQRLSRVVQQLVELERWESFGQQQARIRLCERAEATAAQTLDAPQLALDVRKLRDEWKALDQQHAGVPKALWERFDHACERAYAPAARHFAELAAQRQQARKQREDFIAAAAANAPTLLVEPRDWRAIERWLRETDRTWREGALGSVQPGAWKKLDARLKAALAPLRDALAAARDAARARRQALVEEATALAAHAMEREAPSRVKAIQTRWQEEARTLALPQRDERALWEQFRAACDAVFEARQAKRKEEDGRKHEGRRALEGLCAQLEQLAAPTDIDEQDLRRRLRDLQEQWKKSTSPRDPAPGGLESRFRNARTAVETALAARARSREAAVWRTLAAKEALCEALDSLVRSRTNAESAVPAIDEQWTAMPGLPGAWEKKMLARRDAARRALAEEGAASEHMTRIEDGAEARRGMLLELEMLLGLECPPELQAQRLALQVKQLRDRFQSAAPTGPATAGDRLLAWCAQPGIAEAGDRQRCERVFSAIELAR